MIDTQNGVDTPCRRSFRFCAPAPFVLIAPEKEKLLPAATSVTPRRKRSAPRPAAKAATCKDHPPVEARDQPARIGSVDHVAAEILRALYEGRLVPGQKLLESDITRRFAVGRGSVREALRRLETEGLVTSSLHRGASIRRLTRAEVRDLLEVNEALLGLCARFAAERLQGPSEAKSLRAAVKVLANHVDDANSYEIGRARYAFVEALVALAGNEELARLLLRLEPTIVRTQFRAAYDLRHSRLCLQTFDRVADLVEAKNGKAAELALQRYVQASSTAIQGLADHHFAA